MTATLNNKRILVTRPEHQAGHLGELISQSGGENILFPTIDILAVLNSEILINRFNHIDEYQLIIFVSRNAVNSVFEHYLKQSDLSGSVQLFAIGSGTAAALAARNMTEVLHAGGQADSESLLQLEALQNEFVQNKNVLIVRGVGGRELLADVLTARGASVEYAEVYQRCLPEYEQQYRSDIWQKHNPHAVIVSSNEGLNNLLTLTLAKDQKQLFNTPLVVMSARTVDFAKEMGFIAEIEVAQTKDDAGLMTALLQLAGD